MSFIQIRQGPSHDMSRCGICAIVESKNLSVYAYYDDNLSKIIGLAWDCGAVTTGAVTVPLVLALGIGVSRSSNKGQGSSGGFGIILLASAFPILAVLSLSMVLNITAPGPTTEKEFFSLENRQNATLVFQDAEKLQGHVFTHAGEEGRRAFFGSDKAYEESLKNLQHNVEMQKGILGTMSFTDWMNSRASDYERGIISSGNETPEKISASYYLDVIQEETVGGIRAVVPLSLLLLIVLLLLLREKIRYKDEVALGILFSLIGMILLTSGIRLGLASLGGEVGGELPRAFAKEDKYIDRVFINNFDTTLIFKGISQEGQVREYFNMINEQGNLTRIEYHESRYNQADGEYEHIITQAPLFGKQLTLLGVILVLVFAFGMGFGILALASAFPIITVLIFGLYTRSRQKQSIENQQSETADGK